MRALLVALFLYPWAGGSTGNTFLALGSSSGSSWGATPTRNSWAEMSVAGLYKVLQCSKGTAE